jgi:predicted aconitase with swiveling domain
VVKKTANLQRKINLGGVLCTLVAGRGSASGDYIMLALIKTNRKIKVDKTKLLEHIHTWLIFLGIIYSIFHV